MDEKILPPIKETFEDYDEIERRIIELFKKEIYLPLLKSIGLKPKTLQNSTDDLLRAIQTGQIYFYRGHFKGRFNSTLSKELRSLGARWDRRQGSWKIPLSSLSIEIKNAISMSESKFIDSIKTFNRALQQILPEEIAGRLDLKKLFDTSLHRTEQKLRQGMKGIVVVPELTPEARARIAEEYTKEMQLFIKGWTEKEIQKLRKTVEARAFSGMRYETLVGTIQKSYGVSQSKAKFLARQETNLMLTKFKEVRYQAAGVHEYIWGCVAGSKSHPVRPLHKKLEGKKFRWDDPPITDEKGNRNNPGEDYGCRCFAKPIVKF